MRRDTSSIKPPGSRSFLLGEVAASLAAATPEKLRAMCPGPILLRVPAAVSGQVAVKEDARQALMCLADAADPEQLELHFLPDAADVETLRIGRSTQADVVIVAQAVSRTHAVLRISDGAWVLLDADSTGGTFVEGVKVKPWVPVELSSGTMFKLASYEAMFLEPELLQELARRMRGQSADEGSSPLAGSAEQTELKLHLPPEGMPLRNLVDLVAFSPGMLGSFPYPFLLQIPLEPAGDEEPNDDPEADLTQRISLDEIKKMRRSKQVGDARVHSLRPVKGGKRTVLGRAADCDVVLSAVSPSKRHAAMWPGKDGHWRIMDLESRNGTYVNGKRLPPGLKLALPKGQQQVWLAGYRGLFLLPNQMQGLADTLA